MQSTAAPQQYATATHKTQVLITSYPCKFCISVLRKWGRNRGRTVRKTTSKHGRSFGSRTRGTAEAASMAWPAAQSRIVVAGRQAFLYGLGERPSWQRFFMDRTRA